MSRWHLDGFRRRPRWGTFWRRWAYPRCCFVLVDRDGWWVQLPPPDGAPPATGGDRDSRGVLQHELEDTQPWDASRLDGMLRARNASEGAIDLQIILDPSVAPAVLLPVPEASLSHAAWHAYARRRLVDHFGNDLDRFDVALQPLYRATRLACAAPKPLIQAAEALRGAVRRVSIVSAVGVALNAVASGRDSVQTGWCAMTSRRTVMLWRAGTQAVLCPPRSIPEDWDLRPMIRLESALQGLDDNAELRCLVDMWPGSQARDRWRPRPVKVIRPWVLANADAGSSAEPMPVRAAA